MSWHFVAAADHAGRLRRALVCRADGAVWLAWPGGLALGQPEAPPRSGGAAAPGQAAEGRRPGEHVAPCAGRVVRVAVQEASEVAAGQPIAIIEAMKMEFVVAAQRAGRILRLSVAEGDVVERGAPVALVGLECEPAQG